jgi:hypothetical protein
MKHTHATIFLQTHHISATYQSIVVGGPGRWLPTPVVVTRQCGGLAGESQTLTTHFFFLSCGNRATPGKDGVVSTGYGRHVPRQQPIEQCESHRHKITRTGENLASLAFPSVECCRTARASPSTFVTSGRADLELVRTAGWSRRLRTDLASLIFVFNFSSTYTHTKGCLLLQLSQKSVMIIQNLHNNSVAIM